MSQKMETRELESVKKGTPGKVGESNVVADNVENINVENINVENINVENINVENINDKIINTILTSDRNFMIHGAGGTGKSFLINEIVETMKCNGIEYQKTATTGIAGINIGGITIHRFSGIGLGTDPVDVLWGKISKNRRKILHWNKIDVLIIDEISMMGSKIFNKIDEIAKRARNSNKPFGGLKIICVGDFFQLPPVEDDWVFESPRWKALNLRFIELTRPKRFNDVKYAELLFRIRNGTYTPEDIDTLKSRLISNQISSENNSKILPTFIFPLKKDTRYFNSKKLDSLETKLHTFKADDCVTPKAGNVCSGNMLKAKKMQYSATFDNAVPSELHLKEGAQVMLISNLDVDRGLANGSRGVITGITGNTISVLFCGMTKPEDITAHTWEIEDVDCYATRKQIPLILAYALTCHRTQGCTLDKVICDLGHDIFAAGQAYVSLSRVRNVQSLYITEFSPESIKVDERVIQYINSVKKEVY